MKTTLRSIGALAAVTVALTGCGTMSVNPIAQFIDDSATTTAVKTRLATDGSLGSLTGIGVSTRDDVVRLTGTVADESERARVEAIARRIAGDNRVVSEIRVANSASASVTTDTAPAAAPAPKPVIQKTNQK
jgi:hypothetical protein